MTTWTFSRFLSGGVAKRMARKIAALVVLAGFGALGGAAPASAQANPCSDTYIFCDDFNGSVIDGAGEAFSLQPMPDSSPGPFLSSHSPTPYMSCLAYHRGREPWKREPPTPGHSMTCLRPAPLPCNIGQGMIDRMPFFQNPYKAINVARELSHFCNEKNVFGNVVCGYRLGQ
jgi:hypothetical protein